MPPNSKSLIRTAFEYSLLIVPLYLLAGAPLLRSFFGSPGETDDEVADLISKLNTSTLMIPDEDLICPKSTYVVHILSRDPLVAYIEDFIRNDEASHLVEISEPNFTPSTVWAGSEESHDMTIRLSEKALLPRDHTVKCIEARARAFQGWRPDVFIEELYSQRYGPSGYYRHHFDGGVSSSRFGRISSFMVYLDASCTGGGTNFPKLKRPENKSWCKFIECGDEISKGIDGEELEGITFKAIKGNALYWENFRPDGSMYEESWHAGLPVKTGTKIGLNIWSWYQKGYEELLKSQKSP
ncbi:hypothetical protein M501DRAFT_931857 [Patellaria atrata CBS 101060]|uniref:Prolyl 4-hydroxylase alpha subunit domain-containing protein n=1 Tax=Patellaria atrata CBS 101060 TaxID=1346257 RepID=A0A9P4VNW7_9PEZI|nr:hypothetical protein M501DRAFT_931857 [Patellaria atrata CBS 101060]